ncbi:MAG: cytochrome c oxidase, subunit, partial [Phycisphaerales bacterium]|nr:cytochrome c oxidase, subunit [Phycisphaerales bacterium]
WEVEYEDATPGNVFVTANEIHIPVGRPVDLQLNSQDVIHSFWVPSLHGKKDCVPGHPTSIWLQADKAGEYWGECAEFCGYEHAQMRLLVIAEPQEQFDAWLAAQRSPPPAPVTDSQKRGQQVFQSNNCVLCHQLSGTLAFGRVGPNLSHVGSRTIRAAGAIGSSRDDLARWLVNPQSIKPGTRMPNAAVGPDDLRDLVDFLESRQ